MKSKTVRVHDHLSYKIGVIAAAHGEAAPDWLSEAIGPLIEREYEKALKMLQAKRGLPPQRDDDDDADDS